jgi:uncharacterized protein (DUF2141 family)
MRILYCLSLSLIFAMALAMSCANEDANPKCDGSLTGLLDSKTDLTTCIANDGTITINASGGKTPYKYSLNGGTKQTSPIFTGLSAGTYSVTVFDANNCNDEIASIQLLAPDTDLDLTATPSADNSCATSNGSILAAGSAGAGSYQYKLNSGTYGANTTFSNLEPGTYSLSVKDANGCEKTISVQVSQANTGTTFTANIKSIIDTSCATNSDCHGSGAGGTHPEFLTYQQVKDKASTIFSKVNSGAMPKGGTKLPQGQIDLIACWINDGTPQ